MRIYTQCEFSLILSFLFLKKDFQNGLRILKLSKRNFLERLVPILGSFIELHNHYKILILEPIKDEFNHTKRIIHKSFSNEDLMHFGSLN